MPIKPTLRFHPRAELLEDRLVPTKLLKGFVETPVATGITIPTGMEIAPDGRVFVMEKTGAIKIIKDGTVLEEPFVSIDVDFGPTVNSERGLLGIAFDPQFASNHFVYVHYTHPDNPFSSHNRISRFTADGDVAEAGSEEVLFDLPAVGSPFHNGGAIRFGTDGKLYVGVGDNSVPANAQSLNSLFGKMLRLNPDGSIPTDNPYFNDPNVTGDNKAIWASGLRNPFQFGVDPTNGTLFINDIGEPTTTFEEINLGEAGANYGWPGEQGIVKRSLMDNPIFAYKHGPGLKKGFAITGGDFYQPATAAFGEKFIGDYFFADLANGWIRALDGVKHKAAKFASDLPDGVIDVKIDADGSLLYVTLGGVVNRISKPLATRPAALPRAVDTSAVGLLFAELARDKAAKK